MKVLKFDGKSLSNGLGIEKTLEIIKYNKSNNESFCVVVSARGNATDEIIIMLENAKNGQWSEENWINFRENQLKILRGYESIVEEDFKKLKNLFSGVRLLKDYSPKAKDEILSFGEVISAKTLTQLLNNENIQAKFVNSRDFLITNSRFGNAIPKEEISVEKAQKILKEIEIFLKIF